jgi:predicted metal-binding protein
VGSLDIWRDKATSLGISKAEIIDTKNIVVENWVRLKCQFGCGGYGLCLTCPPHSPMPQYTKQMLDEYSTGLLLQLGDVSLRKRPRLSARLRNIVGDLERELFLDGYHKAFGLGSGPCRLCKPCDTDKPCQHPHYARPAMEACGIDVYQTARNCGFELDVVKTENCPYSYIALILIE